MRKPTVSPRRVLGAVLATALTVGGTVALAGTSEAVATPAITLSPNTGSFSGGTVVSVKGKGFADSTGTVAAKAVQFSSSACTVDATAGTAAASFNVISATKLVLTTPSLGSSAATWYVCVFDGTTSSQTVLGQGTFKTSAAPTAGLLTPATTNVASASVLGGTTVSVAGTNFTSTTKASIDGVAAKATYVSATKLSVVLPAHAAATGLVVRVTTDYGSANTSDTVSYVPVVDVNPESGDGTANNVVSLTGVGFSGYVFGAASTNKSVAFIPAGTTLTAGTTAISTLKLCTAVNVESDTSLSCKAPALSGAYSVVIILNDGASTNHYNGSVTTVSKSATYTAAAF